MALIEKVKEWHQDPNKVIIEFWKKPQSDICEDKADLITSILVKKETIKKAFNLITYNTPDKWGK